MSTIIKINFRHHQTQSNHETNTSTYNLAPYILLNNHFAHSYFFGLLVTPPIAPVSLLIIAYRQSYCKDKTQRSISGTLSYTLYMELNYNMVIKFVIGYNLTFTIGTQQSTEVIKVTIYTK